MPKIRFYHIKTLLWTYLVWAALNLWWVISLCKILMEKHQTFVQPSNINYYTLARVSYYWALLHILPLYGLIMTLWECDMQGFIIVVPGLVAGFAVVAGLLKKGRWARFLIIIGMSIWFLVGFFILGLGM